MFGPKIAKTRAEATSYLGALIDLQLLDDSRLFSAINGLDSSDKRSLF